MSRLDAANMIRRIFSYTGSRCCTPTNLEDPSTLHDYSSVRSFFSSPSLEPYPNHGGHNVCWLALGPQKCRDSLLQFLEHHMLNPRWSRCAPINTRMRDRHRRRAYASGDEIGDLLCAASFDFQNALEQCVVSGNVSSDRVSVLCLQSGAQSARDDEVADLAEVLAS